MVKLFNQNSFSRKERLEKAEIGKLEPFGTVPETKKLKRIQRIIEILILVFLTWKVYAKYSEVYENEDIEALKQSVCPIGETLRPSDDNSQVDIIFKDPALRLLAAERLSNAVKFPTVVNDDYVDPNIDPSGYEAFEGFHDYLEKEFPLVYGALSVEKINKYGLLYTWEGIDERLKPILLTGHLDVVPIDKETEKDWKYDPFSGHFDGENIWGRGSSDCKSLVIATLHGIERLIIDGVVPKRTVILAFGFDEEVGGLYGATGINEVLLERYGENSIYSLIDEGGSAITTIDGRVFAIPSVGEKGSSNLKITLNTIGGHSSVPPDHTNIGLVAKVIQEIEDNPFEPLLTPDNPTLNYLQCVAKYTNEFDESLVRSIFKAAWDKASNLKVLQYLDTIKAYKYTVRTTQAIDIIKGGVKSNALPEFTEVVINHRISLGTSIRSTTEKIIGNVKTIAERFNLGVYYDNEEILPSTNNGFFNVILSNTLSPAPVTPTSGQNWDIFAGSIKHIIEDYIYPDLEEPSVVAPNLNTGNTDTNRYWNLTGNIYRYRLSTLNGILDGHTHGVNERTTVDNQLYLTAFVYEYVKNVFEYATDEA